jgi:two-component system probable response regulator PhcQ
LVVHIDDEETSLKNFTRAFEGQFRILTATNAKDGLKLIEEHADEIALFMTDQRMPGEEGVWLLKKTRRLRPPHDPPARHRLLRLGCGDQDCQQRRHL